MKIFRKTLTVQNNRKILRYQLFGLTVLKIDDDSYVKTKRILGIPVSRNRNEERIKERDDFDGDLYKLVYPDIRKTKLKSWNHFDTIGREEGRRYFKKGDFYKVKQQHVLFSDSNPVLLEKKKNILIHCNCVTDAGLDEMESYLSNIPYPFSLCCSLGKGVDRSTLEEVAGRIPLLSSISVTGLSVDGAQILQVLKELKPRILDYDFFCHLSCSGFQSISGRDFYCEKSQLNSLVRNQQEISQILSWLVGYESGLVFPEPYWWMSPRTIFKENLAESGDIWLLRQKFNIKPIYPDAVPMSGTMFWCRSESLRNLLNHLTTGLKSSDLDTLKAQQGLIVSYSVLSAGFKNFIIKNEADALFGVGNVNSAHKKFVSRIFNEEFYGTEHPDLVEKGNSLSRHYEKKGYRWEALPAEDLHEDFWKDIQAHYRINGSDDSFDAWFYLKTYFSSLENFLFGRFDPYQHYQTTGKALGYLKNREKLDIVEKNREIDRYKFSIIIPVYKSEAFLHNCLSSAYNQTVKNLEIIIVNDGSPDDSQTIIEEFYSKYSNQTKVIIHKKNQGLVTTHTDGINAATGDFFAILDGDDWLSPDFCEKLGNLAIAYEADCVCCRWTRPLRYVPPTVSNAIYQDIRILEGGIKDDAIGAWGDYPNIHYGLNRKLHRKSAWEKYNPLQMNKDILHYEDHVATIRFMLSCKRVVTIRNRLYHWFSNPDSVLNSDITGIHIKNAFDATRNLDFTRKYFEKNEVFDRNIRNVFFNQFHKRLKKAVESDKDSKKLLEVYISYLNDNRDLFTESQFHHLQDNLKEFQSM